VVRKRIIEILWDNDFSSQTAEHALSRCRHERAQPSERLTPFVMTISFPAPTSWSRRESRRFAERRVTARIHFTLCLQPHHRTYEEHIAGQPFGRQITRSLRITNRGGACPHPLSRATRCGSISGATGRLAARRETR